MCFLIVAKQLVHMNAAFKILFLMVDVIFSMRTYLNCDIRERVRVPYDVHTCMRI